MKVSTILDNMFYWRGEITIAWFYKSNMKLKTWKLYVFNLNHDSYKFSCSILSSCLGHKLYTNRKEFMFMLN